MIDNFDDLRQYFINKEYAKAVSVFESHKGYNIVIISNDLEAEITAIAVFSFFNLNNFALALNHSVKLIRYIERQNQPKVADELYTNLLIITAQSGIKLKKNIWTYLFF